MDERNIILNLYEIYGQLLTDREKTYFEYYYFEDYSLTEIADIYSVSKSYVSKYLNKIINKLTKYEEVLKISKKNNKIKELLINIDDIEFKNKIEELL
ncbi:MAG: DNA-binding protein [Tenericutes bacterium]|nr:DNA-binding protein [Mycoplasmatota bacterium]